MVDGVYWNYLDRFGTSGIASVRAASLSVPAAVRAHHRHSADDDLATDGRSYAWTSGRKLSWWQPGMRAPTQVNLADADDHTVTLGTTDATTATTPNRVHTIVDGSDRSATLYEFASALPQLHC